MTRSFANCTPSMEAEGVKSYALAPSIVETQLARYAINPCKNVYTHDFLSNYLGMTWMRTGEKMEKWQGS